MLLIVPTYYLGISFYILTYLHRQETYLYTYMYLYIYRYLSVDIHREGNKVYNICVKRTHIYIYTHLPAIQIYLYIIT